MQAADLQIIILKKTTSLSLVSPLSHDFQNDFFSLIFFLCLLALVRSQSNNPNSFLDKIIDYVYTAEFLAFSNLLVVDAV